MLTNMSLWVMAAADAELEFPTVFVLGFGTVFVGVLGLCWYGRDAWFQVKALWQEKHFVPQDNNISRPTTSSDDGKITVTRDAKEVDYEKE